MSSKKVFWVLAVAVIAIFNSLLTPGNPIGKILYEELETTGMRSYCPENIQDRLSEVRDGKLFREELYVTIDTRATRLGIVVVLTCDLVPIVRLNENLEPTSWNDFDQGDRFEVKLTKDGVLKWWADTDDVGTKGWVPFPYSSEVKLQGVMPKVERQTRYLLWTWNYKATFEPGDRFE